MKHALVLGSLALLLGPAARAQTLLREEAHLAGDAQVADAFGRVVALSGGTLAVGAPLASLGAETWEGAAYVYVRSGGAWTLQDRLAPPVAPTDFFGSEVAVDGDTLAVAAAGDDTLATSAGAVYLYVRNAGAWSLQQKLLPPLAQANLYFGAGLDLDGDELLVGSSGGFAHLFVRSAGTWSLHSTIAHPDGTTGDRFGYSVALDGDTALVGAPLNERLGPQAGSAFAFRRAGTTWTFEARILAPGADGHERFGTSLALEGDRALIGAPSSYGEPQSVHVFERVGTSWTHATALVPPDPAASDTFGESVALAGPLAAVGAPGDDDVFRAGAVHVFAESGGAWSWREKIVPADVGESAVFGTAVAFDGSTLVGGASGMPATVFVYGTTPEPSTTCVGDGSMAACPCGNSGLAGRGCDNAAGTGGALLHLTSWVPNGAGGGVARFAGLGFPPATSTPAVLFRGATSQSPAPFGDGVACIQPAVSRLGTQFAVDGVTSHRVVHGAGAGAFHYQLWYRSQPAAFCDPAAAFNLSNALSIAWP